MALTPPTPSKSAADQLKALQVKHQALKDRKIRLQTEMETAQRELAAAQREAEEAFGTSDVDQLRNLYDETERENAAKIEAFGAQLADIEKMLNEGLGQ